MSSKSSIYYACALSHGGDEIHIYYDHADSNTYVEYTVNDVTTRIQVSSTMSKYLQDEQLKKLGLK